MSEVPQADSISWSVCEHGTLHFELYDKSGNVIARAALGSDEAMDMLDYLVDEYCPEDTMGEVVGHA